MNAKQLLEHLKHLEKLKYPLEMFPVSVEVEPEVIPEDYIPEIIVDHPEHVGIEKGEFRFSGGYPYFKR